jgi:hypothetical protein
MNITTKLIKNPLQKTRVRPLISKDDFNYNQNPFKVKISPIINKFQENKELSLLNDDKPLLKIEDDKNQLQ